MKKQLCLIAATVAAALAPTGLQASPVIEMRITNPFLSSSSSYHEPGFYCQQSLKEHREKNTNAICFGASDITRGFIELETICPDTPPTNSNATDPCENEVTRFNIPVRRTNSQPDWQGDLLYVTAFPTEFHPDSVNAAYTDPFAAMRITYNGCSMTIHFDITPDGGMKAQEQSNKIYICEGPDATEYTDVPVKP